MQNTLQQVFIQEVQQVLVENSHNLDSVNISTALEKIEHAYSIVPPRGRNHEIGEEVLSRLLKLALKSIETFKIDPVIMTVSAIAKLSSQGGRVPLPSLKSPEGKYIPVSHPLLHSSIYGLETSCLSSFVSIIPSFRKYALKGISQSYLAFD